MVWRLPDREIGVPQEPEGLELPPEYITRNSGVCPCVCVCPFVARLADSVHVYCSSYWCQSKLHASH